MKVPTLRAAVATFLRQPSGAILAGQTAVLAALRFRRGRPDRRDLALVGAVAAWWPVQEWLAHRHVLHARPRTVAGRTVDLGVARHHRAHHADPWRLDTTFLPLWFLVPAVPLHALAWSRLAPDRRRAATGMLAFSTATLVYEWTHYLTHTSYRPRRAWFRELQRRHRLHHFRSEAHWYGFTVPFVDDALGTAPDPSTIPLSPTVRTLGVGDPDAPSPDGADAGDEAESSAAPV